LPHFHVSRYALVDGHVQTVSVPDADAVPWKHPCDRRSRTALDRTRRAAPVAFGVVAVVAFLAGRDDAVPHPVGVQFASQPSPLAVFPSSQSSPAATTAFAGRRSDGN
jgi:hypothetical protein